MDEPDQPRRFRRRGTYIGVLVVVLLPFIYLGSLGPIVYWAVKGDWEPNSAVEAFYTPAIKLMQPVPFYRRYCEWWGQRADPDFYIYP